MLVPGLSILGIHLPSLGDLLSNTVGLPFKWFVDIMHHWYLGLVHFFEKEYVNPPQVQTGVWWEFIKANLAQLSLTLAAGMLVIALMVAILWPGGLRRLPRIAKYGAIVLFGIPVIFALVDQGRLLEHTTAVAISQLYVPQGSQAHQPLLLVPIVDNPIGALAGMSGVVFFGGILLLMFMSYSILGFACTVALLPFLALAIFFKWAERMVNWMLAGLIVFVVGGIPLGLLLLKVGEAAADNVGLLDNSVGHTFITVAMLLLAIIAQFGLFWACLQAAQAITGNVYGRSRVRVDSGKLKAQLERRRGARGSRTSYQQNFLGRRGQHGTPAPSGGMSRTSSTRQGAVKGGAMLLAKRYPATALAATAASKAANRRSQSSHSTPAASRQGRPSASPTLGAQPPAPGRAPTSRSQANPGGPGSASEGRAPTPPPRVNRGNGRSTIDPRKGPSSK